MMHDPVDTGIFAAAREGDRLGEPLYLRKRRIRSGQQTITRTVRRWPVGAGVDTVNADRSGEGKAPEREDYAGGHTWMSRPSPDKCD